MRDFGPIDAVIGPADPEDRAFQLLYGPWQPFSVAEAAEVLAAFARPWWVCGGQAIEAFTGTTRAHDDLDIGFFECDLALLRDALAPAFDLWSAGSGMLRPLNTEFPTLHPEAGQVWIREHAWAPGRLDLLATPNDGEQWVNKRDPSMVVDLDEATWTDGDGVRYLAPELVLLMKAKLSRQKDEDDLAAALPVMHVDQRRRLQETLARLQPGHPWLERVGNSLPG
jgi:hypothetical protein